MKRRPAESIGLASAIALLLGRLLGIDDADTITALAVIIGALPAAVTGMVTVRRERAVPPPHVDVRRRD